VLYKKKKDLVIKELEESNYLKISIKEGSVPDYEYLLSMRMDSVTEEKLNKLKEEYDDISNKINTLEGKTNKDLWNEDLDIFSETFEKYQSKLDKLDDLSSVKVSSTLKTKAKRGKKNTIKPPAKKKPTKKAS
jgi:DNA topoisomerase-2